MSTTIAAPDRTGPGADAAAERIARARRALAAAEDAAGVRGGAWAVRTALGSRQESVPEPRLPRRAAAEEAQRRTPSRLTLAPAEPIAPAETDDRFLAVPAALAPLFPFGALRRGTTTVVAGSSSLELHLVAALMAGGAWGAFVARADVGLAAAAEAGVALDRVVVVPRPGPDAPGVLGALVDGFDVVCVGRCRALTDADRRALSARVRHRGGVLLSSDPWPGAELTLEVRRSTWSGVGAGHGMLQAEQLVVEAVGRGLGRRRTIEVEISSDGATTALGHVRGITPPEADDGGADSVELGLTVLEQAG